MLTAIVVFGFHDSILPMPSSLFAQQRGDWRERDQNRRNDRRWDRDNRGRERRGNRRESAEATLVRRLDVNRDGRLDPSEMSGRMEGYLKGLGFDTSRRIRVETILRRIQEQESSNGAEEVDTKVPAFGAINEPVLNFGNVPETSLETQFSQEIMDRVDRMLARYDRNRDGYIDQEEASRVNWGSPTYQQSDSNGDGRLSRWELANRYRARDELQRARREERSDENSNRSKADPNFRGLFNSLPMVGESTTQNGDRNDARRRTDRDERESSDSGERGRATSSRVRTDRDNGQSSDKAQSDRSSDAEQEIRQSSSRRESFEEYDADGNGMIEMHEFADEWDEETIERFYQLDLNGDGVITQREWQEAQSSSEQSSQLSNQAN